MPKVKMKPKKPKKDPKNQARLNVMKKMMGAY